jgi:hypothetical protein
VTGILKRTTYIVADAEVAASRYERIFGWTRYYDAELPVDGRFPPVAPDGSRARLIMLQAEDPVIGMLGFLSYLDFDPETRRTNMGIGSPVLVVSTSDAAALAKTARAVDGVQATGPVEWQVPAADGQTITLRTVSLSDVDGLYFEVSERP